MIAQNDLRLRHTHVFLNALIVTCLCVIVDRMSVFSVFQGLNQKDSWIKIVTSTSCSTAAITTSKNVTPDVFTLGSFCCSPTLTLTVSPSYLLLTLTLTLTTSWKDWTRKQEVPPPCCRTAAITSSKNVSQSNLAQHCQIQAVQRENIQKEVQE